MKQELIPSVRLTDGDSQYFFGYYDIPAFSADDQYHLVHRVDFCDRLQGAGDIAEIGMVHLDSGQYTPLAETTAWNFQQGAMLQWHPTAPDNEIIYNVTRDGHYAAAVLNVHSGAMKYLERPVASVDPTGKYALGINFGRMYDFRPGYGYADLPDPHASQLHPVDDGIYLIELQSGKSRLILSLDQIWNFIQPRFQWEEAKLVVNHITFNTDGSRFVFLARSLQADNRWRTALLSANTDGTGLHCLSLSNVQSHYHWRDPQHLVMYGGGDHGNQLYLYQDVDVGAGHSDPLVVPTPEILDAQFFRQDGHCSYSPDRNWLLYDSYPDKDRMRHLYVYDLRKKRAITLGSYFAPPTSVVDIRCDLHPRWSRSGHAISFDSWHEGQRHVYYMDLREIVGHS